MPQFDWLRAPSREHQLETRLSDERYKRNHKSTRKFNGPALVCVYFNCSCQVQLWRAVSWILSSRKRTLAQYRKQPKSIVSISIKINNPIVSTILWLKIQLKCNKCPRIHSPIFVQYNSERFQSFSHRKNIFSVRRVILSRLLVKF